MGKKRIIWIDDEIKTPILRPYIDEFEENEVDVIKIKSIDGFLDIIKEEARNSLSAILVDIIMPPENYDYSETKGGLRTGLFVLEKIMAESALKGIPLVVVTNVDDDKVKSFCTENNIECIEKKNYFSDEFVAIISEIINKRK